MTTEILRIDPAEAQKTLDNRLPTALSELDQVLLPAAKALRSGDLVAFPTETVYGLGANALDAAAVARIFAAKGRPGDNPLIVHVARSEDILPLTRELPPLAIRLLDAFAPGPLTLILPRSAAVPDGVTAGLDTVAVRIPAHPIARRLIELSGVPLAAPSANRSGRPSPTRAWHVEEDFTGIIPYIIDGGPCEFGVESTVLDLTSDSPVILRPGAITWEMIESVIGKQTQDTIQNQKPSELAPKSPGMKYRHYAPKARLEICAQQSSQERAACLLKKLTLTGWHPEGVSAEVSKIGLYVCRETLDTLGQLTGLEDTAQLPLVVEIFADQPDPQAAAYHLFNALRSFDRCGVQLILAEGLPEQGRGLAYMNRLHKASGGGETV